MTSNPAADPIIQIAGLHKQFGDLEVLKGIDARVERGRTTAIVGPNASGKTTLIKCILGLVRPDDGRILLDGEPLDDDGQYRARIGYMQQGAHFPGNLSAREVIAMLTDLRGNPANPDTDLIDAFKLEPELDKPIRTLSGGTRQKVNAVTAFLFDPDLIILDEPSAGLDPVASSILKDKIRAERDEGTTFLLTSHIMSELDELADDLAFLLNGKIRFEGPIDAIKETTGHDHLERAIAQMMTHSE
jgi:Cu-processing system ATP-binding protein